MPFTVITLKNVPQSLRGDLTRWMQEISTGVYVGNFNSRIREYLWTRVVECAGTGEVSMCFAARNELGYDFKTYNTSRTVVDYDGIPLVMIPNEFSSESFTGLRKGFSTASKMHMAKKNAGKKQGKSLGYVVIDTETTGTDVNKDKLIEIGAVKCEGDQQTYFQCLIKIEDKLSDQIKTLTGITEKMLENEGKTEKSVLENFITFIEDYDLIGYNIAFDLRFLNKALTTAGMRQINNHVYDLMKKVKQEQMFQSDYKLESSLKSYDIHETVTHRALEDAKLIQLLASKVNKNW